VRSEADAAQRLGPPQVPLWEPIATGIGAVTTTGVTAVAGCARAEDRIPSLPATAGSAAHRKIANSRKPNNAASQTIERLR
jgi:hypothetical protein